MLPSCWEIKKCGRETGGAAASDLGVCPACTEEFGHSCRAVAGTLCCGEVQGTYAQKFRRCFDCEVYLRYNRQTGTERDDIAIYHADEDRRYEERVRLKSLELLGLKE